MAEPPRTAADPALDVGTLAAAALVALFFGAVVRACVARPLLEWDALAIWGIKARAIDALGSLDAIRHWGAWPEYPPLVPVLTAFVAVAGEPMAKAVSPLFGVLLYALLYEGLAPIGCDRWRRVLLPLPLVLTPLVFTHLDIAYANLALAVFLLWAVLWLARWGAEGDPGGRLAAATSIALAGLVLVRPEGEVYAAWAVMVAVAVRFRRGPRRSLAWLALPAVASGSWKLYYLTRLREQDDYSLFGVASQGQTLVKLMIGSTPEAGVAVETMSRLLRAGLDPRLWGLVPLVFLLLLLGSPSGLARRAPVEVAMLSGGLAGLSILALYLGPRVGLDHFFDATWVRLYLAWIPLLYLLSLREWWHRFAPSSPAPSKGGR